MLSGIYQIKCIPNGRIYVGSAVNINKRWREHLRGLSGLFHHSRHMMRAWKKYGKDSFSFSVLLYCAKDDLIFFEQRAIDSLKPQFNTSPVAGSQLGYKHSKETRKKLSEAAKRTKNFTGKFHSEESKLKISNSKKGVKQSPETVAKRTAIISKRKAWPAKRKFTEEQIKDIRLKSKLGYQNIDIAKEYNVSDGVISEIKNRKAYRWVE